MSFVQAALGAKVTIGMLDDSTLDVEVPAGTQPGAVLTFKGKGVPRVDGRGKGALHVLVEVAVPKKLSARARTLLSELESELEEPAQGRRATAG